jgi:hypothetical protein
MPADAGYKAGFSFHRQQASESISFRVAALPQKKQLLCHEGKEGRVTMSINEIYRTAGIPPVSVRRIRSVLALSTLVLGSITGYWLLIEYVLP